MGVNWSHERPIAESLDGTPSLASHAICVCTDFPKARPSRFARQLKTYLTNILKRSAVVHIADLSDENHRRDMLRNNPTLVFIVCNSYVSSGRLCNDVEQLKDLDHPAFGFVVFLPDVREPSAIAAVTILERCSSFHRTRFLYLKKVTRNLMSLSLKEEFMPRYICPRQVEEASHVIADCVRLFLREIFESDKRLQDSASPELEEDISVPSDSIESFERSSIPKTVSICTQTLSSSSPKVNSDIQLSQSPEASFEPCSAVTVRHEVLPRSMQTWNVDEVVEWLRSMSFGDYVEVYIENFRRVGVDGSLLSLLTDQSLKEDLGVSCELHRIRILNALELVDPSPKIALFPRSDSVQNNSLGDSEEGGTVEYTPRALYCDSLSWPACSTRPPFREILPPKPKAFRQRSTVNLETASPIPFFGFKREIEDSDDTRSVRFQDLQGPFRDAPAPTPVVSPPRVDDSDMSSPAQKVIIRTPSPNNSIVKAPPDLPASTPVSSCAVEVVGLDASITGNKLRLPCGTEVVVPPASMQVLVPYDKLSVGKRIGIGGFGEVFRGKFQGADVAVKKIMNHHLSATLAREVISEVGILSTLHHPNIVIFMGWCVSPLAIVTEYCPGGSLWRFLRRRDSEEVTRKRLTRFALDISRGVQFFHRRSPPIIHRDLKSPNILVDPSLRLKVSDFGLCCVMSRTMATRGSCLVGTPEWMAPELCRVESYTEKVDVFSYGVILWEMLTRDRPWKDYLPMQVISAVSAGKRLLIPEQDDPEVSWVPGLIRECWAEDPLMRPSFDSITELLEDRMRRVNPLAPKPD
eukprot:Rmarinus@m.1560